MISKHAAHSITADINIEAYAHAAQFFLADGVLLTGQATGHAASMAELETLQNIHENLPVWIGSGIARKFEGICLSGRCFSSRFSF